MPRYQKIRKPSTDQSGDNIDTPSDNKYVIVTNNAPNTLIIVYVREETTFNDYYCSTRRAGGVWENGHI